VRARAGVRVVARDGRTVFDGLRGEAPLALYPADGPHPGWARVWLVGSAGGPLGGDDLELCLEVADGAALAVGTVAASVVLSGASRVAVRATVAAGGALVWSPEPLVVTSGADHVVDISLDVAAGGYVWWRDALVLGRAGERPGRCTVRQRAELDGCPWVRHDLAIGAPGWDGGAVVGDHRAIGSVLTTRPPPVPARPIDLAPDAGGTLTVALAPDCPALDALLPLPEFPVLQRSHHAASRLDA
jgi:urease accessory protein